MQSERGRGAVKGDAAVAVLYAIERVIGDEHMAVEIQPVGE